VITGGRVPGQPEAMPGAAVSAVWRPRQVLVRVGGRRPGRRPGRSATRQPRRHHK